MELTITVCIPSRLDNFDYLVELCNSILNQKVLPNKTIVIASGKPPEVLKNIIQINKDKLPPRLNVEFIISSISGLSYARNLGVANTTTDIIIFGDDDDIWDPYRISSIKEVISNNSPCLARHAHNELINNVIRKTSNRYNLPTNSFFVGTGNLIGGGSNFAGSLSIFKAIPFNEELRFCEDWEFWIRAIISGINIISIKSSLVSYRIHPNRMTSAFLMNYKYESMIRLKYIGQSLTLMIGLLLGLLKSTIKLVFLYLTKYLLRIK